LGDRAIFPWHHQVLFKAKDTATPLYGGGRIAIMQG